MTCDRPFLISVTRKILSVKYFDSPSDGYFVSRTINGLVEDIFDNFDDKILHTYEPKKFDFDDECEEFGDFDFLMLKSMLFWMHLKKKNTKKNK